MQIREGHLRDPRTIELLEVHAAGMLASSPAESCHFLDLSGLETPDISFWTVWNGEELLGMGALKQIDSGHGEIKSMRTAEAHLGKGVGAAMLDHIVATAQARGYKRLSLETGSTPAFEPALRLYAGRGFEPCGAFADYPADDPFSRFMTLAL
ncbi:GNAT family N-acetyltransferase [Sphingomonas sp. AOB5]|uniref:GNAT family N-acetyltransferase n=1 Tax=Sphingomonas sp. AOB5 TaxID=3034017 RepID=UPI0023F9E482|nr:GNAT family N-acetyltransferase [Sphingomonas sp. AOB5]MDF7775108.1 GNAT family N-acetyltransferase [Sphingomonas sp. AOB5]